MFVQNRPFTKKRFRSKSCKIRVRKWGTHGRTHGRTHAQTKTIFLVNGFENPALRAGHNESWPTIFSGLAVLFPYVRFIILSPGKEGWSLSSKSLEFYKILRTSEMRILRNIAKICILSLARIKDPISRIRLSLENAPGQTKGSLGMW